MKLGIGLNQLGYNIPSIPESDACFNVCTYEDIKETWSHKDEVPSEEKILEAYDKWEVVANFNRNRSQAYPSIEEQLDLLWHAIDDGKFNVKSKDTDFYKKLKAVKDANPKPE